MSHIDFIPTAEQDFKDPFSEENITWHYNPEIGEGVTAKSILGNYLADLNKIRELFFNNKDPQTAQLLYDLLPTAVYNSVKN